MNWFERLTGFREESPEQVRELLRMEGNWLVSTVNNQRWDCGRFSAPMLQELRAQCQVPEQEPPRLQLREQVADVQRLHADPDNAGAIFQVASQFNLLEMVSPRYTPEMGVGIYQNDRTQGPACAMAAGAGTIWRNYFMPLPGQIGQSASLQFDALSALGQELGNADGSLWQMRNGYVETSQPALEQIGRQLATLDASGRERLKGLLRIGWQADTRVTLPGCEHSVHQLYCSALPVAYSRHPAEVWEPFARLILEAAYEATFSIACQQLNRHSHCRLYLTLLGGGAFGNRIEWIIDAIRNTLYRYASAGLEVAIVSYGSSVPAVKALVDEVTQEMSCHSRVL